MTSRRWISAIFVLTMTFVIFALSATDEINSTPPIPTLDVLPTATPDTAQPIEMLLVPDEPLTVVEAAAPTATSEPVVPPIEVVLPDETQAQLSGQVVLNFEASTSQAERAAYIAEIGGAVVSEIAALNTVIVTIPAATTIEALPLSPVLASSEPDYPVAALEDFPVPTSDPYFAEQWALTAIDVFAAWETLPANAPQVTVAVIDSGICYEHPDLQGRILTNGYDFIEADTIAQDEYGHGCGVAGIIAANINNNEGIAGVAPNAQILPLRVLNSSGVGRYSDVAAAIVYAVDNQAQVINLSLGGIFPSTVLAQAIDYAAAHNVVVVAAAGNNSGSTPLYPAAYDTVIAVGSANRQGEISSFSNRGADTYAPGENIITLANDGSYSTVSGTSYAAPIISSLLANSIDETIENLASTPIITTAVVDEEYQNVLADSQFPLSMEARSFDVTNYITNNAPHLLPYTELIIDHANYYSINPRIYLAFMEQTDRMISNPNLFTQAFSSSPDFATYLDMISEMLISAFYTRLYQPVNNPNTDDEVALEQQLQIPDHLNSASYALLYTLSQIKPAEDDLYQEFPTIFRNLFNTDSLAEYADVFGVSSQDLPTFYMQLPYSIGSSWRFGGAHNNSGNFDENDNRLPPRDMSAIDFKVIAGWGSDTSNYWVAAAANGTVIDATPCRVIIQHDDGWETYYYHLENVRVSKDQYIIRNTQIANIANTYNEAICNGGHATGPHLHFSLRRNGISISVDNLILSGWQINSHGLYVYDGDCGRFWFERNGVKTCAGTLLKNDATPTQNQPSWFFTSDPGSSTQVNLQGWEAIQGLDGQTLDEAGLDYDVVGNHAYILGPEISTNGEEGIRAEDYPFIAVEMNSTAGTEARILFRRPNFGFDEGDEDDAGVRTMQFEVFPDGASRIYILDICGNHLEDEYQGHTVIHFNLCADGTDQWINTISRLRLYPSYGHDEGAVRIRSIQILENIDDVVRSQRFAEVATPYSRPSIKITDRWSFQLIASDYIFVQMDKNPVNSDNGTEYLVTLRQNERTILASTISTDGVTYLNYRAAPGSYQIYIEPLGTTNNQGYTLLWARNRTDPDPDNIVDFDFKTEQVGFDWVAQNGMRFADLFPEGARLRIFDAADPKLISRPMSFVAGNYKYIDVTMTIEDATSLKNCSNARMYFNTYQNEDFSTYASTSTPLNLSETPYTMRFNMHKLTGWSGTIQRLRFDPFACTEGQARITIESIVLTNGTSADPNFQGNMASQETFYTSELLSTSPHYWTYTFAANGAHTVSLDRLTGDIQYAVFVRNSAGTVHVGSTASTNGLVRMNLVGSATNYRVDVIPISGSGTYRIYWDTGVGSATSATDWNFMLPIGGRWIAEGGQLEHDTLDENGWLLKIADGNDPWLMSPPLGVNSNSFEYVAVTMTPITANNCASARLFFQNATDASFTGDPFLNMTLIPNQRRTYFFNVGANANWTGTIGRIRLDLINCDSSANIGTVLVERIQLTTTNTPTTTYNISNGDIAALSQAIENGNTADASVTINLATNGTYTFSALYSGLNALPAITGDITINGNGATIERSSVVGTPEFRLFAVNSGGSLTLNNVTLDNGYISEGFGGAIFNAGELSISNSMLTFNTASSGGAIYSQGDTSISDTTFSNNAGEYGGAYGGFNGSHTFNNVTFTDNTAIHNGGAVDIRVQNANPVISFDNSTFTSNNADFGGAVMIYSDNLGEAQPTFTDVTFEQNSANYGGAIQNHQATMTLTRPIFTSNEAQIDGGALNSLGGTTNISDGQFTGNTALGNGGAIHTTGSQTISGTVFDANSAAAGGVIFTYEGTTAITGSQLINNTAFSSGAVYSQNAMTISSSCIVGNTDTAVTGNGVTVNATGNWWGASDGPGGNETGGLFGDTVNNEVNYASYLTSAPIGCPSVIIPTTHFISGTVLTSDTFLPIAGMVVSAYDADNAAGWYVSTCTNVEGEYIFSDIPEDTSITVSAGGENFCGNATSYAPEYWQETYSSDNAVELYADTFANVFTNVDFTLTQSGNITITVEDASGMPLEGVQVTIRTGWMALIGFCTDANGQVFYANMPYGEATGISAGGTGGLVINCSGGSYLWELYQDAPDLNSATQIILSSGLPDANLTMTIAPAGAISGTVRNTSLATLSGVQVYAYQNGQLIPGATTQTDSNGNYTIKGIPFGVPTYVRASHADELYAYEWWQEAPLFENATASTLTNAAPTKANVNFTLSLNASLSGTVYDKDGVTPLEGVTVTVDGVLESTCTDAAGHYSFSGLAIGQPYKLHVGGTAIWCTTHPASALWWGNSTTLAGATAVIIPNAAGLTNINFIVPFRCSDVTDVSASQCQSLVDLYNGSNGTNWTNDSGWLSSINVCSWYGVQCTGNNVTALNLGSNNLVGNVNASLGNLAALQTLSLSNNTLAGTIPLSLGNLTQLQNLILSGNRFSGTIPSQLGNLSNLQMLGLSQNQLSGNLPASFGNLSTLQVLALQNNQLKGDVPLSLTNLTNLSTMDVSYNMLTATDASVIAFLNVEDADWANTQTVPPSNVTAIVNAVDNVTLNWTPIVYSGDGGYYNIGMIQTGSNGNYTAMLQTANKAAAAATLSSLPANLPYQFCVQTFTPAHGLQQNNLTSDCALISVMPPPAPPVTQTVGLFNDSVWTFRDANSSSATNIQFRFGPVETGWSPLVGDWNGDGIDGIGVYRDGIFLLRDTSDNGTVDYVVTLGIFEAGWQPVAGDWNGDTRDTVGLYKNGVWILSNELQRGAVPARQFIFDPFGSGNGKVIAGDWDGDGIDSVGLYFNGTFSLKMQPTTRGIVQTFSFGPVESGWLALAGDWNEDGIDTIGIFRDGVWRLRNSNNRGNADIGFTFRGVGVPIASYRGGIAPLMALSSAPEVSLVDIVTDVPESTGEVTAEVTVEVTPAPVDILTETAEVTETVTEGVEVTETVTEVELDIITEAAPVTEIIPTVTESVLPSSEPTVATPEIVPVVTDETPLPLEATQEATPIE